MIIIMEVTLAKRVERNAQLAQLKELAASKSNEALQGKSLEEINKMIAELQEAEQVINNPGIFQYIPGYILIL